jgi:hypothetical protein
MREEGEIVSEARTPDPDRNVHLAILGMGLLSVALIGLALVASAASLDGEWIATQSRADTLNAAGVVFLGPSALLAAFFAGLDERWGWLIAIVLCP